MADAPAPPQPVVVTRRSPIDFVAALAALGLSTYAVVRVLALEEAMKQRSPPETRSVAFEAPRPPEREDESDSDLDSIDSLDEEEAPPPAVEEPPPPPAAAPPPSDDPPPERRQRRTKSVSASG